MWTHPFLVRWVLTWTHPFFQEPTLKFGHGAGAQVQGLDLVLRHQSGHRVLVCKAFLFSSGAVHCFVLATKLMFQNGVWLGEMDLICTQSHIGYSRCEHKTILCRYPSSGSRAPSVDSRLVYLNRLTATDCYTRHEKTWQFSQQSWQSLNKLADSFVTFGT